MSRSNEFQPESQLPPTPEGFIAALDDTLTCHQEAIRHIEPQHGDTHGRTGGDELLLYPNPKDPRDVIRIAPVGQNADDRRFPATQGVHVTYNGRRTAGNGTYRVYGNTVDQWIPDPDLGHRGVLNASNPDANKYADLIDALSRASTERPIGPSKRLIRKLGSLAR